MYGSLGKELGIGPGRRLNREAANTLIMEKEGRYARAVYLIRFTVPSDWNHIGIFGLKYPDRGDGWYYPNKPGTTHTGWVEGSEVFVGLAFGWQIDILEAIVFDRGRPMDVFMDRINRKREEMEQRQDLPPVLRHAVVSALRSILIQTIGSLASRGATKTIVVDEVTQIPAEYIHTRAEHGEVWTYEAPGGKVNSANYHPELAIQIWGRGRAKLLHAPSALGNGTAGALHVSPQSLIGVNGDAIYTTEIPQWALPASRGGGDDGKVGRLRIKGVIDRPRTTPIQRSRREVLRAQAEKAGPRAAWQSEATT